MSKGKAKAPRIALALAGLVPAPRPRRLAEALTRPRAVLDDLDTAPQPA